MNTHENLAVQFFTATANADSELMHSICSADFTGSQNGGPAMNVDALLAFSKAVVHAVDNFRYENVVRGATSTGFVEEHDVMCDFKDGSSLRMPVCVVATVVDGKITSVREYADSAAAKPLFKALS